jgi:alpha-beta hydrolase superfamily lysophospholipase
MDIADSGAAYKVWRHPSPKAKFLLIHGLGANSLWWESFASASLKQGISSYAIDLRKYKSFAAFFKAIGDFLIGIKEESPPVKIFAVGESMGALIILSMVRHCSPSTLSKVEGSMVRRFSSPTLSKAEGSAALKDRSLFDGIVCISPALKSSTPLRPLDYLKIFAPLFYNRDKIYKLPVTPGMCTRDPEYLKVIEKTYDEDVSSTSQVLFDIFVAQLRVRLSAMRVDPPLLFLIAGHDLLVHSRSSVKVFNRLKCKDKTLIEYSGMYHSLSVDLGKEKVFRDILEWAAKRI